VELSEGWNGIDAGTRGAGKGGEERQGCPCSSSQTSNRLCCIVKPHLKGEVNRKQGKPVDTSVRRKHCYHNRMPSEHLQTENATVPPFFPASGRNPFLNLHGCLFVYICRHGKENEFAFTCRSIHFYKNSANFNNLCCKSRLG